MVLPPTPVTPADVRARRRQQYPVGGATTRATLETLGGIPHLHELRHREPVTWCDAINGWLVTSRSLAEEVLSGSRFTVDSPASYVRAVLGDMMLTRDGDEHTRMRRPFDADFRLRPVRERFAEPIQAIVSDLIAALPRSGRLELRALFATPFALRSTALIVGLAVDEAPGLRESYDLFSTAMTAYGDETILSRAAAARDALGARIIRSANDKPDSLIGRALLDGSLTSSEEVAANGRVIMFGAIETVESMVLNTIWALLSHPGALRRVVADESLVAGAVDEALRWLPPVGFTERWAADDTVLAGAEIRRGEFVAVSIAAANLDPATLGDPDTFDIDRPNAARSLAFSHGAHHCLGFNLARLQARIAVVALLRALPALALDPGEPTAPAGFGRTLDRLPVVAHAQ